MFNIEDFKSERGALALRVKLDSLLTEKEKDSFFLKNIRRIGWRHDEMERVKRLKGEGRAKYIEEIHCGYWIAIH